MMLAVAFEPDGLQHDHLVVAFDLLECCLQDLGGVLGIAAKPLLKRANDSARRIAQTVALGVVTRPTDERSNCLFRVLSACMLGDGA